ncbi:MAG: HAD family hydrolase [Spirochaetales bacterium]|nr:HAD family hydrolase [Spirochaetales bacterium]
MKKFKAVFFDLDGTLLNTIGDLANSMNRVLAKYGKSPYTRDEYKLMVGMGVRNLVEMAVTGRGLSPVQEHIDLFVEDYHENSIVDTAPYPGVMTLLEKLSERSITTGVITNKAEELAWKISKAFFGGDQFHFFRGGRDGFPLKPDPEGVLFEAERLGLTADEVVFVGDSNVDMKTAQNAGMFPCGVSWGFRSVDELKEAGAEQILNEPLDLLELME